MREKLLSRKNKNLMTRKDFKQILSFLFNLMQLIKTLKSKIFEVKLTKLID